MEKKEQKKSIQVMDSHLRIKRELWESEVKCFKCGKLHTYETLGNHGTCKGCGISLAEELY